MSRRRPGSYLDTCVLVSLLHGDSGYEAAEAWLCAAADEDLWISHWVLLEFASATSVRMRRGDLSMARVNALQATLECFRHERLAMLEPRGDDFLVARRWIDTDSAPGLRAADALHLALARRQGLRLVSADQLLIGAAHSLGIQAGLVA
jgi:predicted nucleic acid-binding protein